MNPIEFLQVATSLMSGPRPGQFRTAVSRAYYAVYHSGVELLKLLDIHVSKGASGHGDLRNKLLNCGDDDLELVGSRMAELHSYRIRADYKLHLDDVEDHEIVRGIVDTAGNIILELDRCRKEPRMTAVKEAFHGSM